MLKISSNVISLTRGDSADISVPITNDLTGEEYTLAGKKLSLSGISAEPKLYRM